MESTPALVAPRRAAAAVQWKVVWERAPALKAAWLRAAVRGRGVGGVGQGQVCGGGGMKGCLGEKFNMFGSWLFWPGPLTMRGHSTHVSANYAVNIQ